MRVWAIAGAVLCLTTTGCGVIDLAPRSRSARQVDMSDYFAQRLEAGRAHLANGYPTKAIEAFRQASYNPAFAPDAYNGMAVAYVSLGRQDVARDMFVRAIDLDPTDMRFQRNLAKVEEQIMLAKRSAPETTLAAAPKDPDPPTTMGPVVAVAGPRGAKAGPIPTTTAKIREVFIRTAPQAPVAQPALAARVPVGTSRRTPMMVGQAQPKPPAQPVVVGAGKPAKLAVSVSTLAGRNANRHVRIYLNKP